jgi:uncharacterized protein
MTDNLTPPIDDISDDDKLWALLAYIFTPLIPIILLLIEDKKNRPFIRAHLAQALAFGVVALVINIILSFIVIGCITALATLGIQIYWGIKAYKGEYIEIPVVSKFCKDQGWA